MGSDFIILFSFVFTLPLVLLWIKKPRFRSNAKQLPPGPKRLPIIGNLHQFHNMSKQSSDILYREFGPIVFLQLGFAPTLLISSPDVAQEVYKSLDRTFSGRPDFYISKRFSYECIDIAFAPYGEHWKEVRRIAVLELLSSKRVQSFQQVREEELNLMLDGIAHKLMPVEVDLSKWGVTLTSNLISRIAFGNRCNEGDWSAKFYKIIKEAGTLVGEFNVADFFPCLGWVNKFNGLDANIERNFQELNKFYDQIIEQHRERSRSKVDDHEDLVDILLRLQKDPNRASPMSNNKIKAILTDMFLAGSDSSSATIAWTMTELMRNPFIMRKAQTEIREVAKGKPRVQENDLSSLVYLRLIIREVLRLHPPCSLLVPRQTIEECVLGGYIIPRKTNVFINYKAIGRDEKYWENPDEFQPERFLNKEVDFHGQNNSEYIPFGGGRRGCPGISYAMVLVELVLANLLYCFEWKMPEGMKSEDIDMEETPGLTMHKKNPLVLVATI